MTGKTISHYRISEKLGEGGMGVVYKAEDTKLKRMVALKFLSPWAVGSEEERVRFRHEAQAAAAVDDANICSVYEIDEVEGQTFIVMAYIEGQSLKERIAAGPLKIDEAIDVALQIGEGLQAAHEKGIVHRDVKPANILLNEKEQVRITDFGVAKLAGRTKVTKTGTSMGTLAYMSPEQGRGEAVDHRTDIWSLGAMLYEMVTGRLPFRGEYEQAVVYSIMNEEPVPVTGLRTGVPMELERIISKCLQKDRSLRYQHVDELVVDLRAIERNLDISKSRSREGKPSRPQSKLTAARGSSKHTGWFIAAAAVLALFIMVGSLWLQGRYGKSPSEKKRIVVLPFENLGPADDSYFSEGVTEEITSRLASAHSLSVISRNSALRYAGSDKSIRQIGKELDVEYVLEGTVRWARSSERTDRVRITPKLIRVTDDVNVWSNEYDRVISDVFEIQSDIARTIVEQLSGTLSGPEREAVDLRLTDNLDAYHAYLRGNYLAARPHFTGENWRRVEQSYERAVELDPSFALAHANLAKVHARFIFLWVDISDERRQEAKEAAQRALDLDSQSGSVHVALSYYYLWAQRNPEAALAELKEAEKKLADPAEIMNARGYVYEIQGRWEEAIGAFQNVCTLNPRDADPPLERAFCSWVMRRYELAARHCDRAIELAPNASWPYLAKALILWSWKGATSEARAALESVDPRHEWIPWMWFWQETYEGNYKNAVARLKMSPGDWIRLKMWARPKSLFAAFAFDVMNQPLSAHAYYDSARALLEPEVRRWPADPRYHSSLGIAYAALGEKEKAVEEGKRAVSLLPISRDALYGIPYIQDMAFIYTLLGDDEAALGQLEYLLSMPTWFSTTWLSMDPRWNRLRHHPRFRELLKKYAGDGS